MEWICVELIFLIQIMKRQIKLFQKLKKANEETGHKTAILGDLQGPKLRIGEVDKNYFKSRVKNLFTNKKCISTSKKIFVNYSRLNYDLNINDKVLIDDGKIRLKVLSVNKSSISCEVINGGEISSNKRGQFTNI